MHNWRLLLLAFLAVLQPSVTFTERNLIDGREKCSDRNSLLRDSRLSYGYRFNKLPEDHRLSRAAVRADRSNEVRKGHSALTRPLAYTRVDEQLPENNEKRIHQESTSRSVSSNYRQENIAKEQSERLSTLRNDRHRYVRDAHRISSRDIDRRLRERDPSRIRYSRNPDNRQYARDVQKSSSIRASSDDSSISHGNMQGERRAKISMDARRETRWNRDSTEERRVRERREAREVFQRARNDVVRRELTARQDGRAFQGLAEERRAQSETRLQLDNNRERRSFTRHVREIGDDRRSTSLLDLREYRNTDDKRKVSRDGIVSARREFRDRTLDAAKEVREAREMETRKTREFRVRSLEARGESRESRDKSLESRKEVRESSFEARPDSREVRDRTLHSRREIREARDRILEARRDCEFRFKNLEARRDVREVRNIRESRDNTLEERREIREFRVRSLEGRYRSSEGRREARDRTLDVNVNKVRDRTSEAGRDFRKFRNLNLEVRDRSLETRRDARDTTLKVRKEIMETRDRDIRVSRVRNLEPQERSLGARQDAPDRNLEARRENRDFKIRNLEARDSSLVTRREARLSVNRISEEARKYSRDTSFRSRSLSNRKVKLERTQTEGNSRAMMNNHEDSTSRGFESRRLTDWDSRAAERKFHDTRREIRERDASRTRAEIRNSKNAERVARFQPNTEPLQRRESLSINKTQSDSESNATKWQYIFYTLQGIYLCGVLMQTLSQKESSKKQRSFSWLTAPRRLVKVD